MTYSKHLLMNIKTASVCQSLMKARKSAFSLSLGVSALASVVMNNVTIAIRSRKVHMCLPGVCTEQPEYLRVYKVY